MRSPEIFRFQEYRPYLEALLQAKAFGQKAGKARLAEIVQCQPAYISQVFAGRHDFSCEQSDRISQHLGHSDDEREYLLTLICIERSGTVNLKEFYVRQRDRIQNQKLTVKGRVRAVSELTGETKARYYSSWHYAAIHMAIFLNPKFDEQQLSAELNLDRIQVQRALHFLEAAGIIGHQDQGYFPQQCDLHVERSSIDFIRHITNWRLRAVEAAHRPEQNDILYTSILASHHNNIKEIRQLLLHCIEQSRDITMRSKKDDAVYAFNLDFFPLVTGRGRD